MKITDAVYTDADHTGLSAVVDGVRMWVPADARNRFYREVLAQGTSIAAFTPVVIAKDPTLLRLEQLEADVATLRGGRRV